MIYFDGPHVLAQDELRVAQTIASHIALAISRKSADAALRESEERYRRLVEHSPVGVAVHTHGTLVFANPTVARLLGAATPDELLGRNIMKPGVTGWAAINGSRGPVTPGFMVTMTSVIRVLLRVRAVAAGQSRLRCRWAFRAVGASRITCIADSESPARRTARCQVAAGRFI